MELGLSVHPGPFRGGCDTKPSHTYCFCHHFVLGLFKEPRRQGQFKRQPVMFCSHTLTAPCMVIGRQMQTQMELDAPSAASLQSDSL